MWIKHRTSEHLGRRGLIGAVGSDLLIQVKDAEQRSRVRDASVDNRTGLHPERKVGSAGLAILME
jgi:hypothetical protein